MTSRVALRVRGEHVYEIRPLALPGTGTPGETQQGSPAVELFMQRARAAGSDLKLNTDTVPFVHEICRRLDGLPLAIELAATSVPLLAPRAMLERLSRRLPLLAGGLEDLPIRQRTMRDAIVWSRDLLDTDEQKMFRRLSVFVGGCSLDAAEAVCADADGAPTVLPVIATLAAKSIVHLRERADPDEEPLGPTAYGPSHV